MQGVSEETIADYGVYSAETAFEMAESCREKFDADIGIGVTGSFGNIDPNNSDSIPGEVFFAIALKDRIEGFHCLIPHQKSRLDYKLYIADAIADELLSFLQNSIEVEF